MEMLDRYIYEVGRHLPANQREDIVKELKSLLTDALEAKAEGREPTEDDVAQVLREFGKPEDVAARYIGDKYVIGPRLYPVYKLVLTIVAVSLAFGLLVSMAVGYAFAPASGAGLWKSALEFLGTLLSGLLGVVGGVTVVFWVIEQWMQQRGKVSLPGEEPWNPKNLPPVPKRSEAWKPGDSIVSIVFGVLALVLFNGFPDIIAIYAADAAGVWQRFPILAPDALAAYLPYWNIGWALAIALHAVLLAQGRWRFGTNLAHIAVKGYDIFVLSVMIAGPKLLNETIGFFISNDATQGFQKVVTLFNGYFHWILILGIVGSAVEIGKGIYRIVRDRP